MILLNSDKTLRQVQKLPFCYLCGKYFLPGDITSGDHVPPKNAFNARDKEPPLKLRTHKLCNEAHSVDDNKMGLLVGLKHGKVPNSPRNRALNIINMPLQNMSGVDNLNVDEAVWRWIAGFHAALYRQPLLPGGGGAIETPFPRLDKHGMQVRKVQPQHLVFVENIKRNRAHNNLDKIVTNRGKLNYECVWCQFQGTTKWFCMFALDIYGWKDLGSSTQQIPARGCAGMYTLSDSSAPMGAARDYPKGLYVPNHDVFDPFSP